MKTSQKRGGALEEELKQYILGQLTEQDEERFEQRLMTATDEFLQDVDELTEVLHNELVEDYLAGKLTEAQRSAFERRLLPSPKIGEKLLLAQALRAKVRRSEGVPLAERFRAWIGPMLRPAPALAMCTSLLLVAAGGWAAYRISMLQSRLDQSSSRQRLLEVAQESSHRQVEALTRELASAASRLAGMEQRFAPTGGQGVSAVASFILKPGLLRSGGEVTRVAIGPGLSVVELKIDVGLAEYPSYRAAIHDSGDNELVVVGALQAVPAGGSVYVAVPLPARILRPDDYQIRLRGVTASGQIVAVDSYPFRAVRQ